MPKKIIILASGGGSNAENIIRYFQHKVQVEVLGVWCNKRQAGVYARAKKLKTPCFYFDADDFSEILSFEKEHKPDLIVLAGFLRKIPIALLQAYHQKIINIHPALLPKYGGKGMYGMYVHRAVKQANEKESGITIHYVNEHYDEGAVIRQESVELFTEDEPQDIAKKVLALEHHLYPKVIEQLLFQHG